MTTSVNAWEGGAAMSGPQPPYEFDPTDGMTPEERLGFELISSLEGRLVTDDAFRAMKRSVDREVEALYREIDATRVLMVYKKRSWYALTAVATVVALQLRDLATQYDTVWWSLLFPLTPHAGGPWWLELWLRVAGVSAQVGLVMWLVQRAQVPRWLEERVPITGLNELDFRRRYGH